MKAVILDTETTGFDAPEVIELAWMAVDTLGEPTTARAYQRFRPTKPISLGALSTHHIMDEELAGEPPSAECSLPAGVEYIIGHNIDYDWQALGKPPLKRIDVLGMCRTLWPEADSHSLGAMLYLLERKLARELQQGAHSAAVDVFNCGVVLRHCISKLGPFADFEAMWLSSEQCRIPTRMTFGKHKGLLIKDVPWDYKKWLLNQPDVDPYLVKALSA